MSTGFPPPAATRVSAVDLEKYDRQAWTLVISLAVLLVVAYFNSLREVSYAWEDPQYSHGYLIPFFSGVLLWMRRETFQRPSPREIWIGVGLILLGLAARVWGARTVNFTMDRASLIPCLLGVFCMAGGWKALKWAGAPILFLAFMYPLPDSLVDGILVPLKILATQVSNYAMQTLGFMTFRDGNIIRMDVAGGEELRMGVVDACSGLRMLTIFLALCVAFAMMTTHRPFWERLVLAVSAIPIAFIANVFRITITGVLYHVIGNSRFADWIFHDAAGMFMIPVAGGLLYLEYQILTHLLIDVEPRRTGGTLGPRSVSA